MRVSWLLRLVRCAVFTTLLLAIPLVAGVARAQSPGTYTDLHDFGGTVINDNAMSGPDGSYPNARVTFDSKGNKYGTATNGGANDSDGMVWEITTTGAYKDLHDFGGMVTNANATTGPDGDYPPANVTFDSAGDMYGTALEGGPNDNDPTDGLFGAGMVWEITTSGTYIDLHDFGGTVKNAGGLSGPDGSLPDADVTFDGEGNMYGTTENSGPNAKGMVWEITASGTYIDLHDFGGTVINADGASGPDGSNPSAGVTFDSARDIYGTALRGGANSGGMVWEITASKTYIDVHDFGGTTINADGASGPDGYAPFAGVTFDGTGNMYGTTEYGGANGDAPGGGVTDGGAVWEITASGTYKDLHDFAASVFNADGKLGPDGFAPYASVTFDSLGNMYGTAAEGGATNNGMVWALTAAGTYKDLHDFGETVINADGTSGLDGELPIAGVTFGAAGEMYGTTYQGSPGSRGMAWNLAISGSGGQQAPTPIIAPNGGTFTGPQPATITDSLSGASIYYTVNGSIPTASSTLYTGEITVSSSKTIKAIAIASGYTNSAVASASFTVDPVAVQSLVLVPTPVIGGAFSQGTVTLNGMVGVDTTVTVTSSSAAATIPSPVIVLAGQKSATFVIDTTPVAANVTASIRAVVGASSKVAALTIDAPSVQSLTLLPAGVVGGTSSMGTVTLGATAPVDTTVTVSSSTTDATITGPVIVLAGQKSATFTIDTTPVAASVSAAIKAAIGASSKLATLTVVNAPSVASLTFSPTAVVGGAFSTGIITLNISPESDTAVTVTSSTTDATITGPVVVLSGHNSATFKVDTVPVAASVIASVKAAVGASSRVAVLTINAPTVLSLTLSPPGVVGGAPSLGTVTLGAVAPVDITVTVTSTTTDATITGPVVVLAGHNSATFTVDTTPVAASVGATIKAAVGTSSKSAALSVLAPSLVSLVLLPNSVTGGASSTGTVKLGATAPVDTTVTVTSSSADATITGPIAVLAGHNFATFDVDTVPVAASVNATIKAAVGASLRSAVLTIKPPVITGFSVSPTSVVGGTGTSTLTITLSGDAPAGVLGINLASSVPTVLAVSHATVLGGTKSVLVKLSPKGVTVQKTITITGTLNGVSKTTTLTVTP